MRPNVEQFDAEDDEQIVERVAAVDVAKASGMVCTRIPHPTIPGRRVTKVWEVQATTSAIMGLSDQLAEAGIERVVVESTSDYWRPFVYLFQSGGADDVAGQRPGRQAGPGPTQDRQGRRGVAGQAQRAGHAAALVHPPSRDPPTP